MAVKVPAAVYVNDGFTSVEVVVPVPKVQAYVSAPASGSVEVAPLKATTTGKVPAVGVAVTRAVGARFVVTVIGIVATEVCPSGSFTVNVAVNVPAVVYVNEGFASVEVVVPVPKVQAYVIAPASGSLEVEPSNATTSGEKPEVGVAVTRAVGARLTVCE